MTEQEKKLMEFGFKPIDDPEQIEKIEKENEEIVKDVNPILKALNKWTRDSSGTSICKV